MQITTTDELAEFCASAAKHPYVTVDTEFLRERTYFAQLCLVQVGYPGLATEDVALIDTLSKDLSLEPLVDLFKNSNVVKVFHAARQDLEIFWHDLKVFPEPFFDTQIAAMVCGFGDQVGYETLVKKVAKADLDKSSRFTDWSQRPLTDRQLLYAANDVTHLRDIYETFLDQLGQSGRMSWVQEEMAALVDPSLYDISPSSAWTRLRMRNARGRVLAAAMKLAEFRERLAQSKNVPRGRIFKDDALMELAANRPKNEQELSKSRLLNREARGGEVSRGILQAVAESLEIKQEDLPRFENNQNGHKSYEALADILRVLLKAVVEDQKVAPKLIANASDLDAIARGETDVQALKGWRKEIFGNAALKLCRGDTALRVVNEKIELIDVSA